MAAAHKPDPRFETHNGAAPGTEALLSVAINPSMPALPFIAVVVMEMLRLQSTV
jgi:hypothetical protein